MNSKTPSRVVSIAAAAALGAAVAALEPATLTDTATTASSAGAEVGPADAAPVNEQHKKHAHPQHTPEEEGGSSGIKVQLTGQSIITITTQGALTPSATAAL